MLRAAVKMRWSMACQSRSTTRWRKRLLTSARVLPRREKDAGCTGIAARAGVKTLVLSHLLPGDMGLPDEVWSAEARKHFDGEIIVGRDRMVI